jgi:uncharacterized protein (TIGR03437 family)
VALVGNRAQLTAPGFSGGTHTINAAYGGDATFIGSTSNTLMQAVTPPTLTLSTDPNPSLVAQPITLAASLAGGTGVFVGSVQFLDGVMPLGTSTVSGAQAGFTTSTLIAGSHTIVAQYSFDAAARASIIQVVNGLPSQTTLNVNLSSVVYGQPVVFTVQVGPAPPAGFPSPSGQVAFQDNGTAAGVATLFSGTTTLSLSMLSAGTHQIVAIYGGDSFWAPSSGRIVVSVTQPVLQIINSASGPASTYAPDEAVSVFNVTVLNGDTAASVPLPTSLSGVTVNVTDSAGVTRAAQLYGSFASKGQVNLVIPSDTAAGMATLSLTGQGGATLSAMIEITPTAPGIFTATSNGQGVYAGQVVHVHSDGSQTVDSSAIYDPTQNTYVPNPVDMGLPDDQTFLILYGTGIRHRLNDEGVTATVGAQSVPVQSAAQSTYPGLDQLNLQLPRSLAGAGTVNVNINVEGQEANTVVVLIR